VPWPEVSIMSLRGEFVGLARQEGVNRRELCRRYGISPTTAYKWLGRSAADRDEAFADRSRRPLRSPGRTADAMEAAVLAARHKQPLWGGRKLRKVLLNHGFEDVPSASTITEILRRHGKLDDKRAAHRGPWQRFAREAPNELWQMDFKAPFATDAGDCHALTVLDDCSRFALGIEACTDQRLGTVMGRLSGVFRRYGLPQAMLTDNGPPWGNRDEDSRYTRFEAWLIQLGVEICHGRPYHPQTQGKDERLHGTLQLELIGRRHFTNLEHCQREFERWRHVYNSERPHEAIDLDTPAKRYRVSQRVFPERLPPIEYAERLVRKVQVNGRIGFGGRHWAIGKAFAGHPVALRPTLTDGVYEVLFCQEQIGQVDLLTGGEA
jgi:transposase InsO family protein